MTNNTVWLVFALCVVTVSAVSIEEFEAKQGASGSRVLLTWTPSATPSNLTYKLEYHFINRTFYKEILSSTTKSTEILLKKLFCHKATFKLTPSIAGVAGASVETSFTFPEGRSFFVDQITHKTNKHNNDEKISWNVNNEILACRHQFLVNTLYPHKAHLTNKTDFTLKGLIPNKRYLVKVRHVFSDGSWGPAHTLSLKSKYGGSEPEKVNFKSSVDFGRVDIQIEPMMYEKATPIEYFVVSYISGLEKTNVTFRTRDRNIAIRDYDACRDFTVEIYQVTKDHIHSEPSRKMIETHPHTPNKPKVTADYTQGGIKLKIDSEPIQGNWICKHVYEVKVRDPNNKINTFSWESTEAILKPQMKGNYTFAVRSVVDGKAYSPASESVEFFFSGN